MKNTKSPVDDDIMKQLKGTGICQHDLRYPVGFVKEVRGVFGIHMPSKGRIDVLDQANLSSLLFGINQAIANFPGSERIQQPIAIIEFNSSFSDRDTKLASTKRDPPATQSETQEADTKIWKQSNSYSLYEVDDSSERLLFRGLFGPHDSGVDIIDQKAVAKLKSSLSKITKKFIDSKWLRLDCVTVLFNPMEVKIPPVARPQPQLSDNKPATQFQPTEPRFKWGAAKLADSVQAKLDDLIYEVEHWDTLVVNRLYDVFPKSAFVLALSGPAGTGKTTLASGVAHRLGKPIIELSYAAIENALVGEAAKTLKKVFEVAKQTDAVLFIDEADSVASHRPANLSQGADYHISSLRSELFTEISNFDGLLVVATNNAHNYDKAFVSRIYLSIEMGLPDKPLREQLWKRFLPNEVSKTAELAWAAIVDVSEGLSGRDIAKIAKRAAVRAHRRGAESPVDYDDLKELIIEVKEDVSAQRPGPIGPMIERIPASAIEKNKEHSS